MLNNKLPINYELIFDLKSEMYPMDDGGPMPDCVLNERGVPVCNYNKPSGNGNNSSTGQSNGVPTTTQPSIPWEKRDADRDHVLNGNDQCQDTLSGEIVDQNGCASNQRDYDRDYVVESIEVFLGTDYNNPDTDADGKNDGQEIFDENGGIKVELDSDNDSTIDPLDADDTNPCIPNLEALNCDSDSDGLDFATEQEKGTNPESADSDGDGVADSIDVQNQTPGIGESVDSDGIVYVLPTTTIAETTTTIVTTIPKTSDSVSTDSTNEAIIISGTTGKPDLDNGISYLPVAFGIVGISGIVAVLWKRRHRTDGSETTLAH